MRKLITIEGLNDSITDVSNLLAEKLKARLFSKVPSLYNVEDYSPYLINQMLGAYANTQIGLDDNVTILDQGYRSLYLRGKQSNIVNLNYKTCESYMKLMSKEEVKVYHIFILDNLSHVEQMEAIRKCDDIIGGGEYVIVHPNNITTEEIVDFILEEVR